MKEEDIDKIPTNLLYSESEETKSLRHTYYSRKNIFIYLKAVCLIIMVIGIIIFIIGYANTIKFTTIETTNNIDYDIIKTLYIFGGVLIAIGSCALIILKIIKDNILRPVLQDIERSILNDQLEMSGAKINRKKQSQEQIENQTITSITITSNPEYQDLLQKYPELNQQLEQTKNNYEQLNKLFKELQVNNSNEKNTNNELNKKYLALQKQYINLKENKKIKVQKKQKDLKSMEEKLLIEPKNDVQITSSIVLLTISLLLLTIIFVLGLYYTIKLFTSETKDLNLLLFILIGTIVIFFLGFINSIFLYSSIKKHIK